MSFLAIIGGISGLERYLGVDGVETLDLKKAKRFRSEASATAAARAHVNAFPPVITRAMKYKVLPAEAAQ
jgi:hypothetical protein